MSAGFIPPVLPGQLHFATRKPSRKMLFVGEPYEVGDARYARARQVYRFNEIAPVVREVRLVGDYQASGYQWERLTPVLVCRHEITARDAAYLLRPGGVPDAQFEGRLLFLGVVPAEVTMQVATLAEKNDWACTEAIDYLCMI